MQKVFTRILISGSLAVAVLLSSPSFGADQKPRQLFNRVFTVVLENGNYDKALKQPFLGRLASEGALFTSMNGEVHPSQGNYIALTAGSFYDVTYDTNITLSAVNITDLLDAKGKSWKVYVEDYPGECFLGEKKGMYVRKHVPFISYQSIQSDSAKCSKIVDASELDSDIASGQLPDYAFFVPNMKNDGHNTGVTYADSYMGKRFGPLLKDPKFINGMLFITTFDESDSHSGNHIYTTFYGSMVKPGSIVSSAMYHYSLLRLIEDNWGLGSLKLEDTAAPTIDGIWK